MTDLKRWHLVTAFFALLLLRMAIGFHFFSEGTEKIRDGNFESGYFLQQAKGPLAPWYQGMLDDYDGHWRLCVVDEDEYGSPIDPKIDTSVTFAVWDDFMVRATEHYSFGGTLIEEMLQEQIDATGSAREREELQRKLVQLGEQQRSARTILNNHKQKLQQFLAANQMEILSYAKSVDRLQGFSRDGVNRTATSTQVESLREQVDTIARDRQKPTRSWYASIEAIWDSLETNMNALAIDEQCSGEQASLQLHRPYQLEFSMQRLVNQVIPWFDTIVGALLLIGLFTRFASLAALTFLVSVVLSQPFWIPGTEDTWLQWIEIFGLLVLFATCAGRYGGLDFFLHRLFGTKSRPVVTDPRSLETTI